MLNKYKSHDLIGMVYESKIIQAYVFETMQGIWASKTVRECMSYPKSSSS